jgi:hypothetical protein
MLFTNKAVWPLIEYCILSMMKNLGLAWQYHDTNKKSYRNSVTFWNVVREKGGYRRDYTARKSR